MKSVKPRNRPLLQLNEMRLQSVDRNTKRMGAFDEAPAAPLAESAPPVPKLPDSVTKALAQMSLLYGVPFEYLIANERLLPPESIRYFYMDRNWTDRLIDGAISVGTISSRESVFNEAFYQAIYDAVDQAQVLLRSTLKNQPPPVPPTVGGTLSGFLFRSMVVSGWPGVEVQPYQNATPDPKLLPILRLDHLSADVMLCIVDGVPDFVRFIEPSEGLHFGVIAAPVPTPTMDYSVNVRGLGEGGYAAGGQIENPPNSQKYVSANGTFRTGNRAGVLDIKGLKSNIETALKALTPSGLSGSLTPGGFAIQMVRGAGLQEYNRNNQTACGK